MTLTVDKISSRLNKGKSIDEWMIRERKVKTVSRDLSQSDQTATSRKHWFEVTVLSDRRSARGESRFSIDREDDDSLSAAIAEATRRARVATGPLWRLPRPSAPARVSIADARLSREPEQVIAELAQILGAPTRGTLVSAARVSVQSSSERLRLSSEFEHAHRITEVEVFGALALGRAGASGSRRFGMSARSLNRLNLSAELSRESAVLIRSAGASALVPGVYDLVIAADALRQRGAVESWLTPFRHASSGLVKRRGLARHRGPAAFESAIDSEVTLRSDGAIDHGPESAPIDEWGGPVRRFQLIEKGRISGVSYDAREAAIAGAAANGGARNLRLDPGSSSFTELSDGKHPRLEITALDFLRVDPVRGELVAQIALANISESDRERTGGLFSIDLFSALETVKLSSETTADSLASPAWIAFPGVRIL